MIVTILHRITENAIRCVRYFKQRRVLVMASIIAVGSGVIYLSTELLLHPGFLDWLIKLHGG